MTKFTDISSAISNNDRKQTMAMYHKAAKTTRKVFK